MKPHAFYPLKNAFMITGIVAAVLVMGVMVYSVLGGGLDVRSKASDSMTVFKTWNFMNSVEGWVGSSNVSILQKGGNLVVNETKYSNPQEMIRRNKSNTVVRYIEQPTMSVPITGKNLSLRVTASVLRAGLSTNPTPSFLGDVDLPVTVSVQWKGYPTAIKSKLITIRVGSTPKEFILPISIPLGSTTPRMLVVQKISIAWNSQYTSPEHTYLFDSIQLVGQNAPPLPTVIRVTPTTPSLPTPVPSRIPNPTPFPTSPVAPTDKITPTHILAPTSTRVPTPIVSVNPPTPTIIPP